MSLEQKAVNAPKSANVLSAIGSQINPQQNSSPQVIEQSSQKLRRDISQLLYLGRIEEVISAFGFEFRMCTITSAETTESFNVLAGLDDLARINQMRIEFLARSIKTVNDAPLEQIYDGPEFYDNDSRKGRVSILDRKRDTIGKLEPTVLTQLFNEYQKLSEQNKKVEQKEDEIRK